jgi:hypothetical protein
MVNDKLAPVLRRAFPNRKSFTLLLDNEKIMHTEEARAMCKKHGIKVLKDWPAHSPDLNPQENVWPGVQIKLREEEEEERGGGGGRGGRRRRPGVENKLRREAPSAETLTAFQKRAVKYLRALAHDKCQNYIRSMPGRIKDCISRGGRLGRR